MKTCSPRSGMRRLDALQRLVHEMPQLMLVLGRQDRSGTVSSVQLC